MDSRATVTEEIRDDVWDLEKDQAREIQQSLLPVATLKDPRYEVACRYSPLAEVGGDFADFFTLPNDMVGIYIGDVVGKGLAAAMYGALVMGMLRGVHKEGKESAAVLALLNRRLMVRPVPGRYCATLYAIYDPSSRELTFSNAGLPYPVHASHSCAKPLGNGGVPSGLFPDSDYDTHTVQLAPGDAVLFATDGLHEMRNEHSEDFSWGKLGEVWRRSHKMPAEDSLEMLFKEMHRFASGLPRSDDITAVVLRIPWEENGE
ncbi:MAG: PP2C family protein-serine/threonine phosphatase [Candidatus Acidiferrales bacterium]